MKSVPFIILLVFLLASTAAAVTITERPDTIANGQLMYITIRDLPDNATFSLLVEAACEVQPDSEFGFQMSQFVMPFALQHSSITATLSGTSQNRLEVMKESTIVTVSGTSTDGHFSTTKTYDITAGTYDYFRLSGTSLPTSRSITAQLQVTGTKRGPEDSEISFVVEGLTAGTVTTAVLVDNHQVLYKIVPVGGSEPVSPGIGSSSGGPSITAPAPEQWNTFTSADGQASITVSQAGTVGFLKVPAANVTPGMKVLSGPYSLVPQDTSYLPPGKIQFLIPAAILSEGLAVASFSNGIWTLLPSQVDTTGVSATVAASGTYALFGPAATSTPQTTAVTTTQTTVPETTLTPAPAPTTRTNLASFTIILAIGLGCAAVISRKY